MTFLSRRVRSSRGQSLVEAAIVLPVLVLFLLLAIDLGRVFFTTIDLRNAAHEATMVGGSNPDSVCADLRPVVDRQMGRNEPADGQALCGALGATTDTVYITQVACENCGASWSPPYPPTADLRYLVRLEYRFNPVVPLVGLLTGNGLGQSIPLSVENRSPVLKGYVGG